MAPRLLRYAWQAPRSASLQAPTSGGSAMTKHGLIRGSLGEIISCWKLSSSGGHFAVILRTSWKLGRHFGVEGRGFPQRRQQGCTRAGTGNLCPRPPPPYSL